MGSLALLLRLLPYRRLLPFFASTTRPIMLATPGLSGYALAAQRNAFLPLHPVFLWRFSGATHRSLGRSTLGNLLWLLIDIVFDGSPSLHELPRFLMANVHPSMALLAPFVGLLLWHIHNRRTRLLSFDASFLRAFLGFARIPRRSITLRTTINLRLVVAPTVVRSALPSHNSHISEGEDDLD
ncbi:hypothetical protein BKA80DRAFT_319615 [Phyllosticta citrichinensis]